MAKTLPPIEIDAKKRFGTTTNCSNATFILSDGSMLNFEIEGRAYPHDIIQLVLGNYGVPIVQETDFVYEFQRRSNAIRMIQSKGNMNLSKLSSKNINNRQLETIHKCICQLPAKKVFFDDRDPIPNNAIGKVIEVKGSEDCDDTFEQLKYRLTYDIPTTGLHQFL